MQDSTFEGGVFIGAFYALAVTLSGLRARDSRERRATTRPKKKV